MTARQFFSLSRMKELWRQLKTPLSFFLVFLLGAGVGRLGSTHEFAVAHVQEIREGGDRLINPLLECETWGAIEGYADLKPLQRELDAYIRNRSEAERSLDRISVYFRQLNNGLRFGINENDTFAPASMLKVPAMIALLKQAEGNPSVLDRRVKYAAKDMVTLKQNIIPEKRLQNGNSYSLADLLHRSIVYSDNAADDIILREVGQSNFNAVLSDLSGKTITPSTPDDFMTVREYASFFRMLFNASYLDRKMSERALSYLADTRFNDGIVAGVPLGTVVAHKFGERVMGEAADIKELHDCGIVYYPKDPYLLCIMTKGGDFALLHNVIRDVSAIVYHRHDSSHKNSVIRTAN